ncbi:MAG TPA: hypothetical protein PL131_07490 [Methylotenera sp.]|nr:hypothetical protein [Methylotenera sp.]HPH05704.1 hypothetical protein [Methylotenera sp.]HPN01075.1 hypothetical protein [Methylotenera sp.]
MLETGNVIASMIQVVAAYGHFIISLIFLTAAGILLYRIKSVATALFFAGLLLSVAMSFTMTTMITFHLGDSATPMYENIQKLSLIGGVGSLLQAVGFLIFVIELPALLKTEKT